MLVIPSARYGKREGGRRGADGLAGQTVDACIGAAGVQEIVAAALLSAICASTGAPAPATEPLPVGAVREHIGRLGNVAFLRDPRARVEDQSLCGSVVGAAPTKSAQVLEIVLPICVGRSGGKELAQVRSPSVAR